LILYKHTGNHTVHGACHAIQSSVVIANTVAVLEDVVLLLDDEIDERRRDPNELPTEALQLKDTADSVRVVIPKLQVAQSLWAATETLQPDLWLTDSD
jgi:hypothetical protein